MTLLRKRTVAFLFDLLFILFLTVILSNLSYINPYIEDYKEAVEEQTNIYDTYKENILAFSGSEPNTKELSNYLTDELIPSIKKVEHTNLYLYIIYLVLFFLYFVVFQYFTGGQTIGKKLFKIKVVNKDETDIRFINLLLRSIFNGSHIALGINVVVILKIALIFINNNNLFYNLYIVLSFFGIIFELSLILVLFIKKGTKSTHDLIASTKVIEAK